MANAAEGAQCDQRHTKSSHYELQYHNLHTKKPANSFVEPIISGTISPSSMNINHGEVYQIDPNHKRIMMVTSRISLKPEQYEHVMQHLQKKKILYIEAHNHNKVFWQLFTIDPKRVTLKKIQT